jgi:hypothetical protein
MRNSEDGFSESSSFSTCNVDILNDVQNVVFIDLSLLLCLQDVVDGALLSLGLGRIDTRQLPAHGKRKIVSSFLKKFDDEENNEPFRRCSI